MDKLVYRIYQLVLVLMVFWGAHAWFTWGWDIGHMPVLLYVFFDIVALLYYAKFKIPVKINGNTIFAFFLLFLTLLWREQSIFSILEFCFRLFPLIILIYDIKNNQAHLKFISSFLGWTIIVGAIPYLLYQMGVIQFIGVPILYDLNDDVNQHYAFLNHFVFIESTYNINSTLRFQSVFLEPGYLGTLSAFMLYLNRFDLKKYYNVFILIGLVISFSLAAYLTLLFGYVLYSIEMRQKSRGLVLLLLLIYGGVYFAENYNDGNNKFNELILARLDADEEKGIVGNDRFHGDTDAVFEQSLLDGTFLWGVDQNVIKSRDVSGAGFKIHIIQFGLIHLLLVLGFYFTLAYGAINKRWCIFAIIMLFSIWVQATTVLSYRWLIPFMLILNMDKNVEDSLIGKKHPYNSL